MFTTNQLAPRIARGTRSCILFTGIWLAGCSSSGTGALEGVASDSSAASQAPQFDEVQDPRAYCPKTVMRAGTETYNVYPDKMKKDDPERNAKLRFRATITDVVRECNYGGSNLFMKVGVAGRALSGPTGETGSFAMPIRIAVTRGGEVLYSKLHDVPAEIPLGRTNTSFSLIDSDIAIARPQSENIIVYVGFDELRVDIPGAQPVQEDLKPVN